MEAALKQIRNGAKWTILFSIINKVVTFFAQIAIAWFIVPEEMGLVAICTSIATIGQIFTASGLKDVLVQKKERFSEYGGQALYISLLVNSLAALGLFLFAPLFASIFQEPRLTILLRVASISWPIVAFTTPYSAKMFIDLRFREINQAYLIEGLVFSFSAVLLGYLGFGALSMVLPLSWKPLSSLIIFRSKVGAVPLQKFHQQTFKSLWVPSFLLALTGFAQGLQNHGVNFAAGFAGNTVIVGLFFWGYRLASQSVFLLATNLKHVYFPSFVDFVKDDAQFYPMLKKVLLWMNAFLIPICLSQFFVARPLIEHFFPEKWHAGIPVVQYLSLGLIAAAFEVLGVSMLMAMGKYKLLTLIRFIGAILAFCFAYIGARSNDASVLALYLSVFYLMSHLLIFAVAMGVKKKDLLYD